MWNSSPRCRSCSIAPVHAFQIPNCTLRLYPLYRSVRVARVLQDLVRPAGDQLRADARAEGGGVAARSAARRAHGLAAVERDDRRDELQLAVLNRRRERADGRLAAAAERRDERTLDRKSTRLNSSHRCI